mmetsp:Transcript_48087/g.114285  ORF Transcript_48087/g.114285 Transcript_48087/m.114285 type:complete len:731 (-) Transcript_48087:63-2255(-)
MSAANKGKSAGSKEKRMPTECEITSVRLARKRNLAGGTGAQVTKGDHWGPPSKKVKCEGPPATPPPGTPRKRLPGKTSPQAVSEVKAAKEEGKPQVQLSAEDLEEVERQASLMGPESEEEMRKFISDLLDQKVKKLKQAIKQEQMNPNSAAHAAATTPLTDEVIVIKEEQIELAGSIAQFLSKTSDDRQAEETMQSQVQQAMAHAKEEALAKGAPKNRLKQELPQGCNEVVKEASGKKEAHLKSEESGPQESKAAAIKVESSKSPAGARKADDERRDEPADTKTVNLSYEERVPLWIKMCLAFQRDGKPWSPCRPCCLPNCWMKPHLPPSTGTNGKIVPCYIQLTKEQRRDFRSFVESADRESNARTLEEGAQEPDVWKSMLRPSPDMRDTVDALCADGPTDPLTFMSEQAVPPPRSDWGVQEPVPTDRADGHESSRLQAETSRSHETEGSQSTDTATANLPLNWVAPMTVSIKEGQAVLELHPLAKQAKPDEQPPGTLASAPKREKRMAALQCNVTGVCFQGCRDRWKAQVRGPAGSYKFKFVTTKQYKTKDNTWIQARALAMEEAIRWRRQLEKEMEARMKKTSSGASSAGKAGLKKKAGTSADSKAKPCISEKAKVQALLAANGDVNRQDEWFQPRIRHPIATIRLPKVSIKDSSVEEVEKARKIGWQSIREFQDALRSGVSIEQALAAQRAAAAARPKPKKAPKPFQGTILMGKLPPNRDPEVACQ